MILAGGMKAIQLASKESTFDPLAEALKPPPNESPQAREVRIAKEDEARRVSLAIDESLRVEKQTLKKRRVVNLLLLGQSESGEPLTCGVLLLQWLMQ